MKTRVWVQEGNKLIPPLLRTRDVSAWGGGGVSDSRSKWGFGRAVVHSTSCMEQKTSGRGGEGCVLKIAPSSMVFESEVWQIAL